MLRLKETICDVFLQDTQWNDIDYMESNNDFTYDKVNYKGLPEFVDLLHKVKYSFTPCSTYYAFLYERAIFPYLGMKIKMFVCVWMCVTVVETKDMIDLNKIWHTGFWEQNLVKFVSEKTRFNR